MIDTSKLEQEITKHFKKGYQLQSRGDNYVQMIKPKEFSVIWASVFTLMCGVGFFLYLASYMGQKDSVVYIRIDEKGRVHTTKIQS
jgi:hypothetical protein